MQKPSVGRTVLYTLADDDLPKLQEKVGTSAKRCNTYAAGDEVSGSVVKVFEPAPGEFLLNIKAHLDGDCPDLWLTSKPASKNGSNPGHWRFPPGVK
jgi:hypothetical protein